MGEAKRRKKLDAANYGKVFSLRTDAQKKRHAEKIMNDFHDEFKKEFQALGSANFVPENYSSVVSDLASWVQKKFGHYTDPDRSFLALNILFSLLNFVAEASISPVFSICLMDVFSTYLDPEDQTLIKKSRKDILEALVQEAEDFDDEETEDFDYPLVLLAAAKTK